MTEKTVEELEAELKQVQDLKTQLYHEIIELKTRLEELDEEIEDDEDEEVEQEPSIKGKDLVIVALALAAGMIGYAGHDGWWFCLILIIFVHLVY